LFCVGNYVFTGGKTDTGCFSGGQANDRAGLRKINSFYGFSRGKPAAAANVEKGGFAKYQNEVLRGTANTLCRADRCNKAVIGRVWVAKRPTRRQTAVEFGGVEGTGVDEHACGKVSIIKKGGQL